MQQNDYFDIRNLVSTADGCPVAQCTATLEWADSQWGKLQYCPTHGVRIHTSSRTFVYYHGAEREPKRLAAMRNILFDREYFQTHILGHADKAESHRMSHETSEDALTWNVFSRLASAGALENVISNLFAVTPRAQAELYLWGLKVHPHSDSATSTFPELLAARQLFEPRVSKFATEPDIMLYVPGQVLVLIEAKFTSGNTVASGTPVTDGAGEKPRSKAGVLQRYPLSPEGVVPACDSDPFYSQLYRNLVFAKHMAGRLKIDWAFANIVSARQCRLRSDRDEYKNPTDFVRSLITREEHKRFRYYSWESLYNDHISPAPQLADLAEYLYNKSANGERAFDLKTSGSLP